MIKEFLDQEEPFVPNHVVLSTPPAERFRTLCVSTL